MIPVKSGYIAETCEIDTNIESIALSDGKLINGSNLHSDSSTTIKRTPVHVDHG
jgi:hypothetical protein